MAKILGIVTLQENLNMQMSEKQNKTKRFPRDISPQMNVIPRMEFELFYFGGHGSVSQHHGDSSLN